MKVAQNDETNPDTQPVHLPRIHSIANTQLSPSSSFVRKRGTPGIFSRMFPPFTSTTSYRDRAPLAPLLVIVMHRYASVCLSIYCFFPPLLSLDTKTDAAATQYDYGVDDPSYLPEQPGKPPLDHQISPTLLYTACIRVV